MTVLSLFLSWPLSLSLSIIVDGSAVTIFVMAIIFINTAAIAAVVFVINIIIQFKQINTEGNNYKEKT